MAAHSSILARRIPWTQEPGRLQSTGLQRAGHDWSFSAHMHQKYGSETCQQGKNNLHVWNLELKLAIDVSELSLSFSFSFSFSPLFLVCVLSCLSRVWLCSTPWTVACQGPLSKRFSRQEYWSGLPFPPPIFLSHSCTTKYMYTTYVF